MRTSENGGKDHHYEKAQSDEPTRLTEQEAREQLLWELRNQLGEITFETRSNPKSRGDGVVIANINGRQADHHIYHKGEEE